MRMGEESFDEAQFKFVFVFSGVIGRQLVGM